MTGLGTRQVKGFELALTRYDTPKTPQPPSEPAFSTAHGPRSLALQHLVSLPNTASGPLDIIPISVRLRPIGDDNATVSSVSLTVQRRVIVSDVAAASDDQLLRASTAHAASAGAGGLSADRGRDSLSYVSASASDVALLGSRIERSSPAPQASSSSASKPSSMLVASVEASGIPRDATDCYVKTLYLSLPPAKSNNHWALGETLSTAIASVAFFVLVRVSCASQKCCAATAALCLSLLSRQRKSLMPNTSGRSPSFSRTGSKNMSNCHHKS